MWRWRHASVQTKLNTLAMATCIVGLVLASAGIVTYELVTAPKALAGQLGGVADLIGSSNTAAVQFADAAAAREALSAFKNDPSVEAARIDLPGGVALASYELRRSLIPKGLPENGIRDIGSAMIVSRAISLDGKVIGAIHVQGSFAQVQEHVRRYIALLAGVMATACLLAYVLSSRLQHFISGPIVRLAAIAAHVTKDRDYSVRGIKEGDDELGQLVERFNDMLGQIQQRDHALQSAHDELERRVLERTQLRPFRSSP